MRSWGGESTEGTCNKSTIPIICKIQGNLQRKQNNYIIMLDKWERKEEIIICVTKQYNNFMWR